jgi:hypothetical protein
MIDVNRTIISQYANSQRLVDLIHNADTYIDPRPDFDNFYNLVWNIDTAQGFGLDIWGRIIGIDRLLEIKDPGGTFGFDGSGRDPWDQGTFGDHASNTSYLLSDNAYRSLLLLKASINISACDIPTLKKMLLSLFGNRVCYVLDLGGMRIRYVFEFNLTPYEQALFSKEGLVPRPAGVGYEIYELDTANTFGFDGSGLQPFGQGTFDDGGIINVT